MRKYLFVFKTTLMESLQYVMNILMGFLMFFVVLYVFINLWQYVYSDPEQLISGYSMSQMIWYVILTEIIWFGTRNHTSTNQISNDIKSGSIAYVINKPYHYILYMITKNIGEIILKFFLYLGVGLLIGYLFLGSLPGLPLRYLPLVSFVFLTGTLINCFLTMSISVLSFWIEDALPFHWIYTKIILVLGILFPVEMFPAWAQPIIKCTPIYVVTYGPAKLVIDFKLSLFLQVLLVQGIYFMVSFLLLMGIYRKGVTKVNVNGG